MNPAPARRKQLGRHRLIHCTTKGAICNESKTVGVVTPNAGPAAGKTLQGIYKVENDVLTICHVRGKSGDAEKRDRPIDFDVKKRKDVVILTFERNKP